MEHRLVAKPFAIAPVGVPPINRLIFNSSAAYPCIIFLSLAFSSQPPIDPDQYRFA